MKIDTEKLINEINWRREICAATVTDEINEEMPEYYRGKKVAFDEISSLITSLQQEQPHRSFCEENCKGYRDTGGKCFFGFNCSAKKEQAQPGVSLEKEIDACWQNWVSPSNQREVEGVLPKIEFATYARHFYEFGKNSK